MEKYGLIGYPLRHSFSIGYFNEKFRSEGINAEYVNFEIPNINDFMEVIEENPNLCGLNVTIPYKEQVIPFLNELDRDTAKIGAPPARHFCPPADFRSILFPVCFLFPKTPLLAYILRFHSYSIKPRGLSEAFRLSLRLCFSVTFPIFLPFPA